MFFMQLQLKGFMSRVSQGKAAAALSNSINVPATGNLRSEHFNKYVFFIGTTSGYIHHANTVRLDDNTVRLDHGKLPGSNNLPPIHGQLLPASLWSSGLHHNGLPIQASCFIGKVICQHLKMSTA